MDDAPPEGPAQDTPDIPRRASAAPTATVDDVAALLAQADAARAAGSPAGALAPLRAVAAEHPTDARAPLAAFTLGRVLLESLSRPAEAAEAFALARRLAPDGVLSGDALAREVQARANAGQRDSAAALAREYEQRFPQGPQRDAVLRAVEAE